MLIKVQIKPFKKVYESAVVKLWRDCGLVVPQNDPIKDIHRKMKIQAKLFLISVSGTKVVGTVMGGYEGHRGWINYLAVDPSHRRLGIGRLLMVAVERKLKNLGCPKINLQIRESNLGVRAFYEKIGFTLDKSVSYGKRLVWDKQ